MRNHPNIQNCTEEDEFLDITYKCWSKFYSILLQYDYDSRLPLGLFVDEEKSLVFLIRKVKKKNKTRFCFYLNLFISRTRSRYSSKQTLPIVMVIENYCQMVSLKTFLITILTVRETVMCARVCLLNSNNFLII